MAGALRKDEITDCEDEKYINDIDRVRGTGD